MVWEDLVYDDEATLPDGSSKIAADKVAVNKDLLAHYKKLIALRNELPSLRTGRFEAVLIDDPKQLYGFKRAQGDQEVIVVLNNSDTEQQAVIQAVGRWTDRLSGRELGAGGGKKLELTLPAKSAAVLVRS